MNSQTDRHRFQTTKQFIACCMFLAIAVTSLASATTTIQLPAYQDWKKSERKVVSDKKSLFYGIHYIYADQKAMRGYQTHNRFPEGSRIVVEHYFIKTGTQASEGPKNMVVLMKKDRRQTATKGWLYAGYTADGKPSGLDPVKHCFECHAREASEKDYVFSTLADFQGKGVTP